MYTSCCVFLCLGVLFVVVVYIDLLVRSVCIYTIIICSCYYSTATVTGTISRNSNLLDFLANYNRIIASNLLGAMLSVVECAVVFIGITMHGTV